MTIRTAVKAAGDELGSLIEAQVLCGFCLGVTRSQVVAWAGQTLSPHDEAAFRALVEERRVGTPLAYLIGTKEFFGRDFMVGHGVLIPREDTETLIEVALRRHTKEAKSVLDFGTGSGCIAVSLKLERPAWTVSAVDISASAVEFSLKNAKNLGAKIQVLISDGFEQVKTNFDLIVSNPPYIDPAENLTQEVRDHEPELALFAGLDGMDCYRYLAQEAHNFLTPGGEMILEIGYLQGDSVPHLFEEQGWRVDEVAADLNGIRRVVVVSRMS